MSMKKRQTDCGMLLDSLFLSPKKMRYVCYQERHVKTARSRNFTPFVAAHIILVAALIILVAAVNYYKTPFCFHDMRCDLLKLFINPTILFLLVLKHFYLRQPCVAVYCDSSHTRKGKRKAVLSGKVAKK